MTPAKSGVEYSLSEPRLLERRPQPRTGSRRYRWLHCISSKPHSIETPTIFESDMFPPQSQLSSSSQACLRQQRRHPQSGLITNSTARVIRSRRLTDERKQPHSPSTSHPQHRPSMLAPPHHHHYTPTAFNAFLPTIPSPLSPRSANVPTKPFMSAQKADASNTNGQDVKEKTVPFPKRPTKKAPTPTQNELKTQRRKLFLRKVAEGREEGRWERRGEDVSFPNQHQHKRKHKHRHEAGFLEGLLMFWG